MLGRRGRLRPALARSRSTLATPASPPPVRFRRLTPPTLPILVAPAGPGGGGRSAVLYHFPLTHQPHHSTPCCFTPTPTTPHPHPPSPLQAQAEVDAVMGARAAPTLADYSGLKYVMRCLNESMRLYPHPPVLLRRALVEDKLPGEWCERLVIRYIRVMWGA